MKHLLVVYSICVQLRTRQGFVEYEILRDDLHRARTLSNAQTTWTIGSPLAAKLAAVWTDVFVNFA